MEHLQCLQKQPAAEAGKSYSTHLKAMSEYLSNIEKEDYIHCYCIFTTLPSCIVLWCYANPFCSGQVREDLPHHRSGNFLQRSQKLSVTHLYLSYISDSASHFLFDGFTSSSTLCQVPSSHCWDMTFSPQGFSLKLDLRGTFLV